MNSIPNPRTAKPPLLPDVRALPDDRSGNAAILTALMQRVVMGDRDAFGEIYEMTAAVVFSFAGRVLKDPADVAEIVCDVYVQAWQSAGKYSSGRGSVLAWLVMICRTRAIDRHRHNQSRSFAPSGPSGAFDELPETGAESFDLLSALQEGSAVYCAIGGLPPVRRRLLALAFFGDLTHREIAQATKLPESTVKSHIRKALAALRSDLQDAET